MKLSISFIVSTLIGLLFSSPLLSQSQSLIKQSFVPATDEHDTIRFGLLVPPSYKDKVKNYPVIFYLHGLNGHYADWMAQEVAEFLILNSKNEVIPEHIVVFPDGGEGFWTNHYDGDPLLEDEIIKYLIPHIDQSYPTDKEKRLIMGWSAGGAGALYLFSKHPEYFKGVISLDGSNMPWEDFLSFQGNRPSIVKDSNYYYENCSPNKWIAENRDIILEKQDTSLLLAAAFLAPYQQDFLTVLKEEGIPFYYKESTCDHEFGCVFSDIGQDLLIFLSRSLE